MAICKWCGRHYNSNSCSEDVVKGYCCEKCKMESRQSKSSNLYEVEDEHHPGLFGIIWKVIKWVIIIMIVWFVYDNYIK